MGGALIKEGPTLLRTISEVRVQTAGSCTRFFVGTSRTMGRPYITPNCEYSCKKYAAIGNPI